MLTIRCLHFLESVVLPLTEAAPSCCGTVLGGWPGVLLLALMYQIRVLQAVAFLCMPSPSLNYGVFFCTNDKKKKKTFSRHVCHMLKCITTVHLPGQECSPGAVTRAPGETGKLTLLWVMWLFFLWWENWGKRTPVRTSFQLTRASAARPDQPSSSPGPLQRDPTVLPKPHQCSRMEVDNRPLPG